MFSEGLGISLGYRLSLIWAWSSKHSLARLGVSLSANIEIEYISVTFGARDSLVVPSSTDNHLAEMVPFKYSINLPNVFSGYYLQVSPCHRADDIAGTRDRDVVGLFASVF